MIVEFKYRIGRNSSELRRVEVHSLDFITNPHFGLNPGWYLHGQCLDKKDMRSFALCYIVLEEPLVVEQRNTTGPGSIFRILLSESKS